MHGENGIEISTVQKNPNKFRQQLLDKLLTELDDDIFIALRYPLTIKK